MVEVKVFMYVDSAEKVIAVEEDERMVFILSLMPIIVFKVLVIGVWENKNLLGVDVKTVFNVILVLAGVKSRRNGENANRVK